MLVTCALAMTSIIPDWSQEQYGMFDTFKVLVSMEGCCLKDYTLVALKRCQRDFANEARRAVP